MSQHATLMQCALTIFQMQESCLQLTATSTCYNNVSFGFYSQQSSRQQYLIRVEKCPKRFTFFRLSHIYLRTNSPADRNAFITAYLHCLQVTRIRFMLCYHFGFQVTCTCIMWQCALIRNWLVANLIHLYTQMNIGFEKEQLLLDDSSTCSVGSLQCPSHNTTYLLF